MRTCKSSVCNVGVFWAFCPFYYCYWYCNEQCAYTTCSGVCMDIFMYGRKRERVVQAVIFVCTCGYVCNEKYLMAMNNKNNNVQTDWLTFISSQAAYIQSVSYTYTCICTDEWTHIQKKKHLCYFHRHVVGVFHFSLCLCFCFFL